MSYIGSTPTTQSFISGTDYFNGTGSQTAFTLSRTVASVNDVEAVVNNVVQRPNDAYTISGTTITFTSAPSAGTSNIYVRYLSTTTQSITPSQNTVSYATWDSDLRNETWAFRNRIINGDMTIDQRNNGASVSNQAARVYTLDRWASLGTASSKFTVQQSSVAPAGFVNSLLVTSSAATSVGSSDYYFMQQFIEGFNIADLGWGTANAQTVTLSFQVRSSLTGTFCGALQNNAQDRSYPFSYTINAANTWETKTVTIVGDTTGTWLTNNGRGISLIFGLGIGSSFNGTSGSWSGNNFFGVTGAVSVVGTSGATWQVTGVQLEKGFTATNFDVLPYGTELALCQRYFEIITAFEGSTIASGQVGRLVYTYRVTKRAAPTVTLGTSSVGTISVSAVDGCQLGSASAGAGPYFGDGNARANSEL